MPPSPPHPQIVVTMGFPGYEAYEGGGRPHIRQCFHMCHTPFFVHCTEFCFFAGFASVPQNVPVQMEPRQRHVTLLGVPTTADEWTVMAALQIWGDVLQIAHGFTVFDHQTFDCQLGLHHATTTC